MTAPHHLLPVSQPFQPSNPGTVIFQRTRRGEVSSYAITAHICCLLPRKRFSTDLRHPKDSEVDSLASNPDFISTCERGSDSRFAFLYTTTETIVEATVSNLDVIDENPIESFEETIPAFIAAAATGIDQSIKIPTSFLTPEGAPYISEQNPTESGFQQTPIGPRAPLLAAPQALC